MAKQSAKGNKGTLALPAKAKAPTVAASVSALFATSVAPTDEQVAAEKAKQRNAEAIAVFEGSPLNAPEFRSKIDAIGTEGKRQGAEAKTNADKMVALVAAFFVTAEWVTWPIHSLIGPYIEARYGEDARNKYRVALKARCEFLKCKMPTSSGDASGNADKGKSPKRKYAKAARALDAFVTAATEFYATLSADAPSLAEWTTIMATMRALQVKMHADAANDKLKKTA